jgi:HSP20 family protein
MSGEEPRYTVPKWAIALGVLLALVLGVQSLLLFRLWQERPRERPGLHAAECAPAQATRDQERASASVPQPSKQLKKGDPFAELDEFGRDFDIRDWDPLEEMKRMREHMDSLFDDSFGRFNLSPGSLKLGVRPFGFSPKLDLQEKDDCYVASMDLPGANKNDISVKLEDRVLTVSGQIQETVEQKDRDQVLRKERRSGKFERTLTLPGPVLPDKMDARYENGVLAVTIPKAKEVDTQTKTIHVQ